MPKPGDQVIKQIQAAIAALQDSLAALVDLVSAIDVGGLQDAVTGLGERVEALENATPGVDPPNVVHWRTPSIKLNTMPANGDTNGVIEWDWVGLPPKPQIEYSLDGAERLSAPATINWSVTKPGMHSVDFFVAGADGAELTHKWNT